MSSSLYIASDLSELLRKYIKSNSIDANDLVRELDLFRNKPSSRLSYKRWCDYINQLIELTGDPCLGIELGTLVDLGDCGVLGHLALNCSTLAEALAHFSRYQTLLYDGAGKPEMVGNIIRFGWKSESEEAFNTQQSDEVLLVGLSTLMNQLIGRDDLKPHKVGFMHSKPSYASAYEHRLGSNIEYDQPLLFVELPLELLFQPISNCDPSLRQLLDQQANALLRALPELGQFETALKTALIKCMQEGTLSLDVLSSALNISDRTLHRKLENYGLNFSLLLQKTRKELAIEYLREHKLSIVEISLLLGYSEQSAFTRAFKKWTGKSPRKFI